MVERDPTKPWSHFLLGFSLLSLIAVVGVALFVQFWANRPVNYTRHTALLADQLEEALIAKFVPEGSIHRAEAEVRKSTSSTAYWNYYRFDVDLPRDLSPEGLKQLVRDEMLLRNVTLTEIGESPAAATWSLSRGEFEFARVVLQVPPAQAQRRDDLRELSLSVADALDRALRRAGTPEETLIRSVATDQEDAEARWAMTRFAAVLPPGLSPGDLEQRLWEDLAYAGVSLSTDRVGYSTMLAVKYGGRRFAEVLCSPATLTAVRDANEAGALPSVMLPTSTGVPNDAADLEDGATAEEAPIPPPPRETELGESAIGASGLPDVPVSEAPSESERAVPGTKPGQKTARMAIILDDGGNNRAHSERVLAMDFGLTLAILPHTPYGRETASEAANLGFEVMLHMPMETDSKTEDPGPGKVLTSMSKKEIQWRLRDALSSLVEVKGVNNHTGSRFTSDADAMRAVLEVLKEESLFFIDSWTSNGTVAYKLASEMGVRTAHRDVFLDHDRTAGAIQRQYEELIATAKRKGVAIGIGHFQSPHTLALLEKELPKLEAQGIELVHASELAQ